MEYTYLVGEGPQAVKLIDDALAFVQKYREDSRALFSEHIENPQTVHAGTYGRLIGLGRLRSEPIDEKTLKLAGLKFGGELDNDSDYYVPNLRTKAGKELDKKITVVNQAHASISDFIINALGINHALAGPQGKGMTLFRSAASFRDEKIFISIPGKANKDSEQIKYFPSIPDWLRKPQGDEYEFFLKRA